MTLNEMGVNNEYVWDITFKSHLGSQAILEVDSLDLKGSLARIFSSRIVRGQGIFFSSNVCSVMHPAVHSRSLF